MKRTERNNGLNATRSGSSALSPVRAVSCPAISTGIGGCGRMNCELREHHVKCVCV